MASKVIASTTLLLCLNLVFFTLVSSNYVPCPPPPPKPSHHGCPSGCGHVPTPTTPTTPSTRGKCPTNALKLKVCGKVLNGLINVVIGVPKNDCCALLEGLTDLDAAVCLCTALKADLLGLHLDVPISLSLLLNFCKKAGVPSDFQCPST